MEKGSITKRPENGGWYKVPKLKYQVPKLHTSYRAKDAWRPTTKKQNKTQEKHRKSTRAPAPAERARACMASYPPKNKKKQEHLPMLDER